MEGNPHPQKSLLSFSTSILGTWNFWWKVVETQTFASLFFQPKRFKKNTRSLENPTHLEPETIIL